MLIGLSALSVTGQARTGSAYTVEGYTPPLVLDFERSVFNANGTSSTASSAYTASRTGLATQLDASGNLVWNAHNLIPRSQDFSFWSTASTSISVTTGKTDPDGGLTAVELEATGNFATILIDTALTPSFDVTTVYYVRRVSGSGAINIFAADGTPTDISSSLTSEWQPLSVTGVYAGGGNFRARIQIATSGDIVQLAFVHAYRSDLGGMAPVPLTRRVAGSTTYVPTTSAAVYLPREEAYTYVSGSLVGPYYQKESDARTNLVTYSEDFTDASWAKVNAGVGSVPVVTANQGISPSGETTADRVQFDLNGGTAAGDVSRLRFSSTTVAASTGSFWVKSFDGTPYTIGFNVGSTLIAVSVTSEWQRVNATFSSSGATAVDIQLRGAQTPTNSDTADILLWGAQHEEGSTPTSYIPTSGSTVIRPADSTTIAAGNMPYPTPQIIGPELVTNGTFDTDFTGWTQADLLGGTASTYSVVSQEARIQAVSSSSYGVLKQSFTTVIGKLYNISFEITTSGSNNNGYILRVGTTDGGFDNLNGSNSADLAAGVTETVSKTFIATSTTTHITIGNNAVSTAQYNDFDNISVREINPLALSFQLEGLVTYADEGAVAQYFFINWGNSGTVGIYQVIDTHNTRTGSPRFGQITGGARDEVEASFTTYSPGINVPFNIASRHGSTFINGAVDGTALTANTTPTALPDLSATTFELAPTFNGFIKEFRVWADDIGDTGIAEAST